MSIFCAQMPHQPLSSDQIRAARAILDLTSEQLAKLSGIGLATMKRFEGAQGILSSRGRTLDRVRASLENAGVEFIGHPIESPGVRLRRRVINA